jgi:hypothetical protein
LINSSYEEAENLAGEVLEFDTAEEIKVRIKKEER